MVKITGVSGNDVADSNGHSGDLDLDIIKFGTLLPQEGKMKLFTKLITGMALAMGLSFAAQANDDWGTPEEAKAMSIAAGELIKAKGMEAAKAEFMSEGGKWHDRDLYVFVQNKEGVMVAHGAKAALVGKNLMPLKDPTGYAFVKEGVMKITDQGWVDYSWQHPLTKKVAPKTTYIVVVDGEYYVGVGAYK